VPFSLPVGSELSRRSVVGVFLVSLLFHLKPVWARSSVGQSSRLIIDRSWVQVPPGPLLFLSIPRRAFRPVRRILTVPSTLRYSFSLTRRGRSFVDWRIPDRVDKWFDFLVTPPSTVPDNRLYKLRREGEPVEGRGPYETEDRLIDALVELSRADQFEWGELVVHVYETDATPLGIGRKYLGAIDGGTVLLMGEVDEERVQRSR
jgi:hypothetical protein